LIYPANEVSNSLVLVSTRDSSSTGQNLPAEVFIKYGDIEAEKFYEREKKEQEYAASQQQRSQQQYDKGGKGGFRQGGGNRKYQDDGFEGGDRQLNQVNSEG
jgi:hypothetical protein